MDKKKARGFVAILVLMVLVVIVIMIWKDFLKSKTPEIEQLKNDFWNEKLNPDVYSISKFEVETETDGKEDTYKAIVCVAYDNATVEYVRRYHYTYNKYDEWVLGTIEDYEEESWTIRPLTTPTSEECKEYCLRYLHDRCFFAEYDTFKEVESKREADLEKGMMKVTFYAEKIMSCQSVSGEIEFELSFDYQRAKWEVVGKQYKDTYAIEHNLKQSWSGTAMNQANDWGGYIGDGVEKNFRLEITEIVSGNEAQIYAYNYEYGYGYDGTAYVVEGVLIFDDVEYTVLGEILIQEEAGKGYQFDMRNENEKLRIDGHIETDGIMNVQVDTAYNKDSMFFHPRDRYSVTMDIVK